MRMDATFVRFCFSSGRLEAGIGSGGRYWDVGGCLVGGRWFWCGGFLVVLVCFVFLV